MLTDQERTDYLAHLNRIQGELSILLDGYSLGADRPIVQRAFDAIWQIRERVQRDGISEPEPVYLRIQALERKASERRYRLHIEDSLLDLIPVRVPFAAGDARTFGFSDTGIQAAMDWLDSKQRV